MASRRRVSYRTSRDHFFNLKAEKWLTLKPKKKKKKQKQTVLKKRAPLPPHLALPLLVPSEELPDLVQEPGVLLPAAQPEGGLSGAACGCHCFCAAGCVGRVERVACSCRSLKWERRRVWWGEVAKKEKKKNQRRDRRRKEGREEELKKMRPSLVPARDSRTRTLKPLRCAPGWSAARPTQTDAL